MAALLVVFSAVQFYLHYRDAGKNILEQGRRVEISVPDGAVKSRETLEALRQIPEEDRAAKREEAFEKQASGEGNTTGTAVEEKPVADVNAVAARSEPSAAAASTITPAEGAPAAEGDVPPAVPQSDAAAAPPPKVQAQDPKIAIIITGVGLSRSTMDTVFTLPANIALSISPYASKVADVVKEALAQGYEVMIDLPLEPADYPLSDPGPLALLTGNSEKQNLDQLDAVAALADDVAGLVAVADEQFTYSVKSISPVLGALAEKKMRLLYASKPGNYFLSTTAEQLGADIIPYQAVLDEKPTAEAIFAQLSAAVTKAKETGLVVVVARPYPITIETINKWMAMPQAREVRIVSAQEINQKENRDAPKEEQSPTGEQPPEAAAH